jgi:hypothetical protein
VRPYFLLVLKCGLLAPSRLRKPLYREQREEAWIASRAEPAGARAGAGSGAADKAAYQYLTIAPPFCGERIGAELLEMPGRVVFAAVEGFSFILFSGTDKL